MTQPVATEKMFHKLFGSTKKGLSVGCLEYLKSGPLAHMSDYVPESITEIIIAHGAEKKRLDPELKEIAHIITMESNDLAQIDDPEIKAYMLAGAKLFQEVLARSY